MHSSVWLGSVRYGKDVPLWRGRDTVVSGDARYARVLCDLARCCVVGFGMMWRDMAKTFFCGKGRVRLGQARQAEV